jgi:heme oxygenase-like protein
MTTQPVEMVALSHEEASERIHTLARGCAGHPALRNAFYELWMSQPLSADQVEVVARNFYERVRRTPDRIALAFLHMTDLKARAETVENLSDEMGHGNAAKVHSVLLREFFESLLSRLRGRPVDFDGLAAPVLASTVRLVEAGEKVFSSPYPQEVCGALLAQEWHAYPQLVYLYEGVRNYRKYYELEEFHESCEYFYLHIGATEKEHKIHSLSTAAQMCHTSADIELLERGFYTYLDLLAENWAEIHAAIQAS